MWATSLLLLFLQQYNIPFSPPAAPPPSGITFVSDVLFDAGGTDNPVVNYPSSMQNDDLILVFAFQAQDPPSHTITTDTFTQDIFDKDNIQDDVSVSFQYRKRDGTEGSTFTLDDARSGTHHWAIWAVAFRGVDTTTPMDVAADHNEYRGVGPAATGSPPLGDARAPSITTVTDDAVVVHFFATRDITGSPGLCTDFGPASGDTEPASSPALSDQNRQATYGYYTKATAGATGDVSPTVSSCPTDSEGYAVTVALRPA